MAVGERAFGRRVVVHECALVAAAVSGDPAGCRERAAAGVLMNADRRRDVALFRYALVRELDAMRPRERGRAVRQLAASEHLTPWGERVSVF